MKDCIYRTLNRIRKLISELEKTLLLGRCFFFFAGRIGVFFIEKIFMGTRRLVNKSSDLILISDIREYKKKFISDPRNIFVTSFVPNSICTFNLITFSFISYFYSHMPTSISKSLILLRSSNNSSI